MNKRNCNGRCGRQNRAEDSAPVRLGLEDALQVITELDAEAEEDETIQIPVSRYDELITRAARLDMVMRIAQHYTSLGEEMSAVFLKDLLDEPVKGG